MAVKRDFGLGMERASKPERSKLIAYINIRLASLGLPIYSKEGTGFVDLASDMLENFRQKDRILAGHLAPADRRIQDFLDSYLGDIHDLPTPRLPSKTLVLDRYGMARELSLPPEGHSHASPTLTSYRIKNGVLHTPGSDKRTTEGVFHIAVAGNDDDVHR
jgi:hypothetical protein